MLNVVAVGDNVAISAIEVEEVEACPTVWMYTDSTGCDYAALQPFLPATKLWRNRYILIKIFADRSCNIQSR